jgi:hypothetical protein
VLLVVTGEAHESTWPLPAKAGGESEYSRLPETLRGEMLPLWPVPRLLDVIMVTKSETCAIQAAAHNSVTVGRLHTALLQWDGTVFSTQAAQVTASERKGPSPLSDCGGCVTQAALTDQVPEQTTPA